MAINENPTVFLQTNLRCLRKRLSHSQEELAQKIGLNRGNIASYENGSAEPRICNLLKLANLFQVTIIDLTQKDLSAEDAYQSAITSFQQTTDAEREFIRSIIDRVGEIEEFLESIYNCQRFKAKSLADVPAEMKFALYNFEQLFDVTKSLLQDNRSLLDFICCKMKQLN